MEFTFILKKLITAFIMPLSIGLLLGLIGLIYLYQHKLKKAKVFLTISLIWIVTISYEPFSAIMIQPLETKYEKLEIIPDDVKYILLLGGDMENRGWEALRLYHKIKDVKIITSGYAGNQEIAEAIRTANILQELGIPKDKIIIHDKPKDTKEEAIIIKQILKDAKFILVTSGYHMPRAMKIFQKEGLNPIPAPTDFRIKHNSKFISTPYGMNLNNTERAWHEYIGTLWARIRY